MNSLLLLLPLVSAPQNDDDLWDRLSFYANGRLRWESTFDQANGEDRHRGRFRARVGADYQLMDGLDVRGRLSTLSPGGDANNPHWDFGSGDDGFRGAELTVDRLYLDWRPCDDFELRGGKMPHVFQGPPIASEFLWDADVQPGGFAGIWGGECGKIEWDVRGAAYVAVESSSMDDATMFGGQANGRYRVSDTLTAGVSSSYQDWSNLGTFTGVGMPGNQGNTNLDQDFGIFESHVTLASSTGPLGGWQTFGQYFFNTEIGTEDEGYAFGARVGKGGSKGDVNFFASYYHIEADAIFSPVAQDDTPIAGSGAGMGTEGLIAGGQYYVEDNVSLKLWVLTSDTDTADPFRIRFDLDFRVL